MPKGEIVAIQMTTNCDDDDHNQKEKTAAADKNLSTFEPKRRKQQACDAKAQNGWTTVLLELECENKDKMRSKLHQWVSRRELVD